MTFRLWRCFLSIRQFDQMLMLNANQEINLYVADDAARIAICCVLITDHTSVGCIALLQVLVVAGIVVVVVAAAVWQLYNIWYGQVIQFEMVQIPETLSKLSSSSFSS